MKKYILETKEVNTKRLFLESLKLVEDMYKKQEYIEENQKLPIDIDRFQNNIYKNIVSIENGKVVATASMFFYDKEIKVPSYSIYSNEIDSLIDRNRRIVEGGMLASLERIPLLYCMSLFFSICKSKNIDDIILSINPKHLNFYKKILFFEQIGELKQYDKLKNAPAILIRFTIKEFDYSIVKNDFIKDIFVNNNQIEVNNNTINYKEIIKSL